MWRQVTRASTLTDHVTERRISARFVWGRGEVEEAPSQNVGRKFDFQSFFQHVLRKPSKGDLKNRVSLLARTYLRVILSRYTPVYSRETKFYLSNSVTNLLVVMCINCESVVGAVFN